MVNVIGQESPEYTKDCVRRALGVAGAGVHWYGKAVSRKGRKMAHITVTADSEGELVAKADALGVDR